MVTTAAAGIVTRWRYYLALVAYGGLFGSLVVSWLLQVRGVGGFERFLPRMDFIGSYIGGYLIGNGQRPLLYDLATQMAAQQALTPLEKPVVNQLFIYPAWNLLVFVPLALLPYVGAFIVWAGINLVSAAVAITRLVRFYAGRQQESIVLVLAMIAWTPLCLALELGQLSIVIWLGITGALLALHARHDWQAGLWLTLGLLKPQLIVFLLLALLVSRRWKALGGFAAGAGAVFLASLLLFGNWITEYLALLRDHLGRGEEFGDIPRVMQNWRGLVFHLLGSADGALANVSIGLLTLVSVGLIVALCWPRGGRGPADEVRFAVVLILGLLIDPHFYWHDATLLLTAGVFLLKSAQGDDKRLRLLWLLLLIGPFLARVQITEAEIPGIQLNAWYLVFVVLAALWAWPLLRLPAPLNAEREVG